MFLSEPSFKVIAEKHVIGLRMSTTLQANETKELWKSFIQKRNLILHRSNQDLISMHLYDPHLNFFEFNDQTPFEKWACAEVQSPYTLPEGMECFVIPTGLYAVFQLRGDGNPFTYIFENWLPQSDYILDKRPHFEIMGLAFQQKDPQAYEELHIPILKKN